MSFSPYHDRVSVVGVDRDGDIRLEIGGSSEERSGDYWESYNRTMTVTVEPDTARELIADLETTLEEVEE